MYRWWMVWRKCNIFKEQIYEDQPRLKRLSLNLIKYSRVMLKLGGQHISTHPQFACRQDKRGEVRILLYPSSESLRHSRLHSESHIKSDLHWLILFVLLSCSKQCVWFDSSHYGMTPGLLAISSAIQGTAERPLTHSHPSGLAITYRCHFEKMIWYCLLFLTCSIVLTLTWIE